jgi:hypothetical protein
MKSRVLKVWLRLFFKVFFILKYIKIYFFILKKLFLRSTYQNDSKHAKKMIFLGKQVDPRFQMCSLSIDQVEFQLKTNKGELIFYDSIKNLNFCSKLNSRRDLKIMIKNLTLY